MTVTISRTTFHPATLTHISQVSRRLAFRSGGGLLLLSANLCLACNGDAELDELPGGEATIEERNSPSTGTPTSEVSQKPEHVTPSESPSLEDFGELRRPVAPRSVPAEFDPALVNRAYVVNRDSDNLLVIDLERQEVIANIQTGGISNHMAALSLNFEEVVVDSSHSDQAVIIDASKLELAGVIDLGRHPAHITPAPNGLMAVMEEDDDAVAFIDPKEQEVVVRIGGPEERAFRTPHFMRFDAEGKYGYVANISGYHITRVDMETMQVDGLITLAGHDGLETDSEVIEAGFADAQIDSRGVLYAAHAKSGRVLVYDTLEHVQLDELKVGKAPWVVFATRHFDDVVQRHLVPNFGDATVSLIDGSNAQPTLMSLVPGDEEAYGVNFSGLVPDRAFVMNRVGESISVVDSLTAEVLSRIDVGGNVETASTTRDGRFIVAAVSGANKVVIVDVEQEVIVKTFDDVGLYPWSVTIPFGQNYCH